MQMNKTVCSSSTSGYGDEQRDADNFVAESVTSISSKLNQCLQLDQNDELNSQTPLPDSAGHADADDEDEDEFENCDDGEEDNHEIDEDFSFMNISENKSQDKASENGQIQPVFQLFDRNLLSGEGGNQLPYQPPVDKVFVEWPHRAPPSSTSKYDELEGIAAGPYCTWSKQPAAGKPELGKKSNSTGFSKLWRLRSKVGRSNSGGRDAFVFRKSSDTSVNRTSAKADGAGEGKSRAVIRGTKTQISAHEAYMKMKEQTEEERRRSYLPYRPELRGFFTNVNGGLSRNVHPY